MSVAVDDRIVRFSVDDSSLVKKGPSVVNMLGKMKEALNFSHSAKGLQDIEKAAKKINWESMASGAEVFTGRISALSIMGITTIQRYTNQALHAVENFAKELTTRPIFTGFSEYEIKMDAIQTILTNTAKAGTTLDDVNRVLGDLNQYADLTIYNFAEMTRNIGTFTAAGIGLEDAAAAIKGISNVAAASGVNATKAAGAMYQLSQGMAAGVIRLQDWMSIEQAGMGGQLFQESLIETARVHGISIDKMIKEQGSFRYTLQEGWLTAEIMSETLQKFTGDLTDEQLRAIGYSEEQIASIQETAKNAVAAATEVKTVTQLIDTMKESVQSGWSVSWEYIIGDKQQATETLTRIKDAFDAMLAPSTEARNNALKIWNELGGRDAAIEGFVNIFTGIKAIVDSISGVVDAILPDIDGYDLVAFSKGFEEVTRVFKMSGDTAISLEKTFAGIGVVLKFLGKGVFTLLSPLKLLGSLLTSLFTVLLKFTSVLGGWLSGLDVAVDKTSYIADSIGNVYDGFKSMIGSFSGFSLSNLSFDIDLRFDGIQNMLNSASSALSTFRSNLSNGINEFKAGASDAASNAAASMLQGVSTVVGWIEKALTAVGNGLKAIGSGIKSVGDAAFGFVSGISDSFSRLVQAFNEAWSIEAVRDITLTAVLVGVGKGVKKAIKGIGSILTSFADVMTSVVNTFKSVSDAIKSVATAITSVSDSIQAFNKSIKARTLLTMAAAIAILAGSLVLLSYAKPELFLESFAAVSSFLFELVIVMQTLDKLDGSGLGPATIGLVLLATAVGIMAAAMSSISKSVTGDNFLETVGAFTASVVGLAGSAVILSKYVSNPGQLIGTAVGLIIMASAFKTMAKAIAAFGSIDPEVLKTGLKALAVLLAEVAVFIRFAKLDQLKEGKKVVVEIAVALLMMVGAVSMLGSMKPDKLIPGLLAVGGLLLALGVTIAFMKNANMEGVALTLLSLAMALNMLVVPILLLGHISSDGLIQGLGAMGAMIVGLVVALSVLAAVNKYVGSFAGISVALIALAAAINLLLVPIVVLSLIPFEMLSTGLLIVAGSMAALVVSAMLLAPMSVGLLAVSAAFALLGVSILGIGVGISALATAFLKLAAITAVGATAVVGALTAIIAGLVAIVPEILAKLGEGIVSMIVAIASAIVDNAVILLDKLGILLDKILLWLAQHAPALFDTAVVLVLQFLLTIIRAIDEYAPLLVDAFVSMVINVINSIANAIRDNTEQIFVAIRNLLSAIIEFVLTVIAELLRLIPAFGDDLADTVLGFREDVQAYLAPESMEKIATEAVGGLEKGLNDGASGVGDAADTITKEIEDAMSGLPASLTTTGENAGEGLAKGLLAKKRRIKDAAIDVSGTIENAANERLEVRSPSRRLIRTGKFAGEGLAIGLLSLKGQISDAGHTVGDTTITAIEDSIKYIWDLINGEIDMNPRITPVVDMSNVKDSAAYISKALRLNRPIAMSTVATASDIADGFYSRRSRSNGSSNGVGTGDTYNYYQTINSPKPINRFEVYRHTKSLISRKKGGS